MQQRASDVLLALTMDSTSEYLQIVAQRSLDKILGDSESDAHQEKLYKAVMTATYELVCIEYDSE